jgi:hypothetical protein
MTEIDRIERALDRIESMMAELQTSSRVVSSTARLAAVHEACSDLGARLQHLERGRRCDA